MTDRTGWLIERYYNGALHYWNGRPLDTSWVAAKDSADINSGAWSEKHSDAIWFADEGSAAIVLSWALGGVGRVAQHMCIQKTGDQ